MNEPLSSPSASERAWQWWLAAWTLFFKKPRQFLLFGFFYLAFLFLVFFLALKNERLPALFLSSFGQPFFVALLFRYIRVVDKPEERRRQPSRLSAAQKKSWSWYLLWRLRFHFPPLWHIFWHLHSNCRLSGAQARVLIHIGIIGFVVSFANAALGDLLLTVTLSPWPQFFVLLISILWWMAFWCAPLLVVWRHCSAVKALLFSFLTACFNWRPILCVLLLLFAVTLIPLFFFPVANGWLFLIIFAVSCLPVAVMIYFCLLYQIYLDFFPFPAHVSEHA